MRVLAFRRPRVRVLAVATAAFAAFSLTACESGADAGASAPSSEGSHPATAPETSESGSDTEPAGTDRSTDGASGNGKDTAGSANGAGGTGGGDKGGSAGASGSGSGSGSDASPVACTAANTKIVVTSVSRPINHLLVTATNTGKVPCFAYHAPFLRFDAAQAPVPVVDASVPQAVVTLEPGESAYAGVMTAAATGEGEGGRTARKVTVTLAARSGDAGPGSSTVTLPSGGVYVDSTHTVTYWQQEMDQALAW
jgi:hypothetical protein